MGRKRYASFACYPLTVSGVRFVPLAVLLALLAFVPGVLAGCGFGHEENGPPATFNAQTAPTPPSPVAVAAFVMIPVAVIGGALAIARRGLIPAVTGQWVATPTQWIWVENRK